MKTTPLTISSPILRLIFVLLSSPIFTAYADEVRPYPYIHADAEMVKQAIRLLVDGEYKMAFNRHQQVVLISAPEILHEKIAAVLQKIDRPVKNIQVQVAFKKQAVQTDRGSPVAASLSTREETGAERLLYDPGCTFSPKSVIHSPGNF
jgi:hypothetical protein